MRACDVGKEEETPRTLGALPASVEDGPVHVSEFSLCVGQHGVPIRYHCGIASASTIGSPEGALVYI